MHIYEKPHDVSMYTHTLQCLNKLKRIYLL